MTEIDNNGSSGHLSDSEYERTRATVPILCVDVLARGDDGRYLLICRHDRRGATGWNLVGGRIKKDEHPSDAAARHIYDTLGTNVTWERFEWQRPTLVAEYVHAEKADGPFDPDQHALSLTYLIELKCELVAMN